MLNALTMLAAVAVSPVQADAPLKPLGKWQVDWSDRACFAVQTYGDAQRPTTFALKPSLNGDVIRLIIMRNGPDRPAAHFPVTLGDVKTTALVYRPEKTDRETFWINLPRADFDRLAATPALSIKGQRLDLTVATTGFAVATKAMDECNTDLRAHWNADEAGEARIAIKAEPHVRLARIFSSEDYPSQAARERRGGGTEVSLLIDEAGTAKDCMVEQASGVATIDAQTCLLIIARGKFSAARDAKGQAIKSRLSYRIKWTVK